MPQGQVIGRISVRVLPDTERFRRDAERELDAIEKRLSVEVDVMPDMAGFTREMLTNISKINQQNRQSNARRVRIFTRLDTSMMVGDVARAVREYTRTAKAGRRVKLPTDLAAPDLKLKISDKSLRDMTDRLEKWRDDNSPLKIEINPDVSALGSAVTNARLGILTRPRTVSIVPVINEAALAKVATALAALAGLRVLDNLFEKFRNILRNLDESVPLIGTLSTAIAGLAALGLTTASNLFALSASLAQIGAVALTLPGILGGFAFGIGVTIAALKDFNSVLPEVSQLLSQLQDQISANFWAQALGPIREMVDILGPRFATGIQATATEVGKFFAAFATDFTSVMDPGLVDAMFGYLNASIQEATTGTSTFASIIAQLGEVGASYLPNLAGWFVDISRQFDVWLQKKGAIGLREEIDAGIQSLKDLGGVLYETTGILAGMARAATEAGGSTLGMLRETLAEIHRVVDSDGFQAGMIDVFAASHEAMARIADISGPAVKGLFIELGALLTTILPQAGTIIGTAVEAIASALSQPAVTQGVVSMFAGLEAAVNALAPAMAPLGLALGALMEVIAAMLPAFAALVTAAVIPLANAFAALAPQIIPIVELLAGALTTAFTMLAPLIEQMVPLVGQLLGAAFSFLGALLPPIAEVFGMVLAAVAPLAEAFISALAPILPVLASALGLIITALQPIIEIALQLITAIITPLLPMLSEIIQGLLPPLAEALVRVVEALQPVLVAFAALVEFLMPILVPILEFVIGLLADSLVAAVNGVALVIEGLVQIFTGAWDIIVGVLKMAWGIIEGIFTGDFSRLAEGWNQLWDGIWSFVKGIWDIIVGAFAVFLNVGILGVAGKVLKGIGAAFKAGWEAVKKFGTTAWEAIKSAFTSFGTTLQTAGSSMMSAIGRAISSGWTAVRTKSREAFDKIISIVKEKIEDAIKAVKELPQKAKDGLKNLGNTLKDAGKKLIEGFINGIKAQFDAVKNTLTNLTDKLSSWKGPEHLDRVLLVKAGQLVIDGFINGLESRYDEVRRSLRGLTKDVADTDFGTMGAGEIGVTARTVGAVNSALAAGGGTTKVLNYYAAPGSISSEEDLFAAADRARFGW